MSKNAISLKQATFSYPKSNFNFSCEQLDLAAGEITLVVGKNGSGKTTLMKLCCGVLRPQEGSLTIFGEDAGQWTLGRIGKDIGYLFQEPSHQIFSTTVWDEMTFLGSIIGKPHQELQKRALELLGKFALLDLIERSVYSLSRGEKQRLALASILMQDIRYLILDEPTTGLDIANRQNLYAVLDSLFDEGIGMAIITHSPEIITRYGSRQLQVTEGRIVC